MKFKLVMWDPVEKRLQLEVDTDSPKEIVEVIDRIPELLKAIRKFTGEK